MKSEKFFHSSTAIITLFAACFVVLISLGVRQTFGLFFQAFEEGLGVSRTEFGLAIGIQMICWGIFAPIFGLLADKFGGNKAVFIGFITLVVVLSQMYMRIQVLEEKVKTLFDLHNKSI